MSASRFLFFPQRLYVSATSFKSVQQGFYLGYKPFTAVSYKADTFFFWERVVLSEAFNTATDRYYWNNYKIRNVTLNSTWHVLQKYYICFVLLPLTIRNQESVTINNQESEIGHWRRLFFIFYFTFYAQTWRNFQCRIPTFKLTSNSTTIPSCGRQDFRRISSPSCRSASTGNRRA